MSKRIAIIPIRSGSKGLKDKNILPLNGKPLVAYTIEAALRSKMFDEVFVSTDSEEYAKIAEEYGANASFLRSQKLSGDAADSWDVVREVIDEFEKKGQEFEEIMLLQATSPLRDEIDICKCVELMEINNANSIQSVCEMNHSPLWSNQLPADGRMDDFAIEPYDRMPRQSLPKYYRLNGAIYLLKRSELYQDKMFRKNSFAYIMPTEKSVDIDNKFDFQIAELLIKSEK